MNERKKSQPGDGIRSLKTSNLFRALNFELYIKPNKAIMCAGAIIFLFSLGYIGYMRRKYESLGYQIGVQVDGSEQLHRKRSNWE